MRQRGGRVGQPQYATGELKLYFGGLWQNFRGLFEIGLGLGEVSLGFGGCTVPGKLLESSLVGRGEIRGGESVEGRAIFEIHGYRGKDNLCAGREARFEDFVEIPLEIAIDSLLVRVGGN